MRSDQEHFAEYAICTASETTLRVKMKGQNVIAGATSSLFTLTYYFICGYGGIGRRARFRF